MKYEGETISDQAVRPPALVVPGAHVRKATCSSFAHCTDPRHCLPISYTLFGGESAGIAGPAPGKAAVKSATVRAKKQAEPKIDDLSGDISADDTLLDEEVNVDTVRQEETPESSADTMGYPACKPWMDYRAVTDTASLQYELISQASHEDNGLLTIDGYYLAALGSAWGEVGSRYEMRIGDKTVRLIKADEKQDAHTLNGEGLVGLNGHLAEMIVDTARLDNMALLMGDCNYLAELTGEITEIIQIC